MPADESSYILQCYEFYNLVVRQHCLYEVRNFHLSPKLSPKRTKRNFIWFKLSRLMMILLIHVALVLLGLEVNPLPVVTISYHIIKMFKYCK